jgi:hypothetical protein
MRISDLAESIGIRPKPYRILTLDGGGVRGIIPVLWLERLEKSLGGPVHAHFRRAPQGHTRAGGRRGPERLSHLRSFALHWRPFAAYSPRS